MMQSRNLSPHGTNSDHQERGNRKELNQFLLDGISFSPLFLSPIDYSKFSSFCSHSSEVLYPSKQVCLVTCCIYYIIFLASFSFSSLSIPKACTFLPKLLPTQFLPPALLQKTQAKAAVHCHSTIFYTHTHTLWQQRGEKHTISLQKCVYFLNFFSSRIKIFLYIIKLQERLPLS